MKVEKKWLKKKEINKCYEISQTLKIIFIIHI